MKNDSILFIEMDTHKEFTEVAYSLDGRNYEIIHLGRIPSTKQGLLKLVRQFQSKYPNATLHFLYEAGPCGYWMYRLLSQQGHCCYLVAPSLIPKKPGKRVKTDKRDAMDLCRLLKNGDIILLLKPYKHYGVYDYLLLQLSLQSWVIYLDLIPHEYQHDNRRKLLASSDALALL